MKSSSLFKSFNTFVLFCLLLVSCNDDPYKGLSPSEKKLAQKIITDMKNDTSKNANSANLIEQNSNYYYYYDKLLGLKDHFDPIKKEVAKNLQLNYDTKRAVIERTSEMRNGSTGMRNDTKSIWIPSDSLFKLMSALIKFEVDNSTKTGIQIVLGSYRYNYAMDNDMSGGQRRNKDTLSGRTTLFFVATYDTVKRQSTTYALRQKQIPIEERSNFYGLSIYNHGALCPEICPNTDFK